jgi:hypothetical protein
LRPGQASAPDASRKLRKVAVFMPGEGVSEVELLQVTVEFKS